MKRAMKGTWMTIAEVGLVLVIVALLIASLLPAIVAGSR
jgi:hypothetical protein